MKAKNVFVMFIFSAVMGGIIGAIIWIFLRVMNLGIDVLWHQIPGVMGEGTLNTIYPLLLCTAGGVIVGLMQKKYGPCPEELDHVIGTLKAKGTYDYSHVPRMLLAALLPLLFGGALGPEAGLTGVIVGLCCWVGDNIKFARKTLPELADVGIAATLSVLFGSPLFGFVVPVEEDIYSNKEMKLPKGVKIFATFCAIFGGLVVCMLLGRFFGPGAGLPRFESTSIDRHDILLMFPVVLIGVLYGWLFKASEKVIEKIVEPFKEKRFIIAVAGGAVLGAVGIFFPIAMFSGEKEMEILIEEYALYSGAMLFVIAGVKMILINICLCTGWRGGHFFPAIFAGVAAGFACAAVMPIDPVFSCAVACAAVMTTVMRKPFAVAMLLMLCFPVDCLLYLIGAAFLAAVIPDIFGGKKHESA
ncbi:MAG: chloride channel protein [Firmicutes bacterium]|nr:chloride channel protein [Bacillota bacterium]